MLAKVTGDYSAYPAEIRDALPYIEGELAELRTHWQIYHSLFMESREKTEFFSKQYGPLLGIFDNLIAKEMVLSISCLTDKDSKSQENLSLWVLTKAVPFAHASDFEQKVTSQLNSIISTASITRKLRNKQIAHYDLSVSLGHQVMPTPLLKELKLALEQMETYVNLFHREFEKTEVGFDSLSSDMIVETAIVTACKAKVFDELESENKIPIGELERRMDKWTWWKWH